ncbi:MAG: TolC family protein, partial [Spirosomaceae bacterium]|nr:TolC family protein [Spirosomataceae bacterium]
MKKIILIFTHLLMLSFTHCAWAQRRVSLSEAVSVALQNRLELKNQQVQVQLAQLETDKLRARWMPQISGSADMRWNTQIQTSVIKDAAFIPGGGDAVIRLGVPFNNTLTLNAEQKIYDAQKKIERQITQTNVAQQQVQIEKLKNDIRLAVNEAYLGALWAKEKAALSAQTVARAKTYLTTAQAQLEKGTILPNEVEKLRLDVSNAEFAHRKNQQDEQLSWQNLLYQMGETQSTEALELTENLATLTSLPTLSTTDFNTADRPEIKAEQAAMKTNELNALKQKAAQKPTLGAYGTYGTLQFNDVPNPFAANTWFNYNFV